MKNKIKKPIESGFKQKFKIEKMKNIAHLFELKWLKIFLKILKFILIFS
jgi:hypothetical protein